MAWETIKPMIPDIIEGVLWIISMFMFITKTVKVVKTHTLIKLSFRENNSVYENRDKFFRQDMKTLSDETKQFIESTQKSILEERIAMQNEIKNMKNQFENQIQIYKDSIYDIVKNDKFLVQKGISESVLKRFEIEEDTLNENKMLTEETTNGYQN